MKINKIKEIKKILAQYSKNGKKSIYTDLTIDDLEKIKEILD